MSIGHVLMTVLIYSI